MQRQCLLCLGLEVRDERKATHKHSRYNALCLCAGYKERYEGHNKRLVLTKPESVIYVGMGQVKRDKEYPAMYYRYHKPEFILSKSGQAY